jgi:hypothetical protein
MNVAVAIALTWPFLAAAVILGAELSGIRAGDSPVFFAFGASLLGIVPLTDYWYRKLPPSWGELGRGAGAVVLAFVCVGIVVYLAIGLLVTGLWWTGLGPA